MRRNSLIEGDEVFYLQDGIPSSPSRVSVEDKPLSDSPLSKVFWKKFGHQLASRDSLRLLYMQLPVSLCILLTLALGLPFFTYVCNLGTVMMCFIIFTVFCLVQLTNSDGFFITVGMGYAFVGVNILFELSATSGYLDGRNNINTALQCNSFRRLMEVLTLIAGLSLSPKRFKTWFAAVGIFGIFLILQIIFMCMVAWWKVFPRMYDPTTMQKTKGRSGIEIFCVLAFVVILGLLVFRRKYLRISIFVNLFLALTLRLFHSAFSCAVEEFGTSDKYTGANTYIRCFTFIFLFTSVGLSMLRTPHKYLSSYLLERNEALQSEKIMVNWMIEQVPAIIIITDAVGKLTRMNRYALKSLKVKNYMEAALGHNFFDFFHFEDKEECQSQFNFLVDCNEPNSYLVIKSIGTRIEPNKIIEWNIRIIRSSSDYNKELSNPTPKASPKLIKKKVTMSMEERRRTLSIDDEEIIQVLCSGKDVTEKSESEALLEEAKKDAERLAQMKDTFVANVSHELRTPLNCILGVADLMTQTEFLDDTLHGLTSMIKPASNSLLQLIGDLLDYAKLNQGQMKLALKKMDLRESIENSALSLAVLYRESGLDFGYRIEKNCPHTIVNDENRFRQVLLNLLTNAIKFTPKGQILLRAKRCEKIEGSEAVEISVTDSGIGMSQEELQQLFEDGLQGPSGENFGKRIPGTGIGLAITKHLLRLMGGGLSVNSEVGRGTRVTFQIPVVPLAGATFSPPSSPTLFGRLELRGSRDVEILQEGDQHIGIFMMNEPVTELLYESLNLDYNLRTIILHTLEDAIEWFKKKIEGNDNFSLVIDSHLAKDFPWSDFSDDSDNRIIQIVSVHCKTAKCSVDEAVLRKIQRIFDVCEIISPIQTSVLIKVLAKVHKKNERRTNPHSTNTSSRVLSVSSSFEGGHRSHPMTPQRKDSIPVEEMEGDEMDQIHLYVLVVEDNKTNQKVMGMMLDRIGNVTHHLAEDGKQAVEKFLEMKDQRYDCIFMDYQMPVMDGPTSAAEIRRIEAEDPTRGRTHIAALTANALTEEKEKCFEVGMDDYLTKPLSFVTFTSKLNSIRKMKRKNQ